MRDKQIKGSECLANILQSLYADWDSPDGLYNASSTQ